MTKKREVPRAAATDNGAVHVYRPILAHHRKLINRFRNAALRGSFFMALAAMAAGCMTEDLTVSLVLVIPAGIWAGLFVLANGTQCGFWEDV